MKRSLKKTAGFGGGYRRISLTVSSKSHLKHDFEDIRSFSRNPTNIFYALESKKQICLSKNHHTKVR